MLKKIHKIQQEKLNFKVIELKNKCDKVKR